MFDRTKFLWALILLSSIAISLATVEPADAAKLTLKWVDTSDAESGFRVERRSGSGSYQQVVELAANSTTYTDANLAGATSYCYRVNAFNSSGSSPYSNESCATTAADSFALTISRVGTGSGSVTSSPAGISCGADCTETYTSGTTVTLSAIAAAGSVFSGWSGPADCTDGQVTVNTALQCTANFTASTAHVLSISLVNEISAIGSASGRVISSPSGIDCGSDCTESYLSGQVVTLTPIAAANSKFAGWTGDSDCSDGGLTMTAARNCTAKFQLSSATLSVNKKGKGNIKATAAGIDCGTACAYTGVVNTVVTLRATPESGSVFTGWSGGCSGKGDCTVTLLGDVAINANFDSLMADKIGVYRPQNGDWFLDRNGSGAWEGCAVDLCIQFSAGQGTAPVVGDWTNSGTTRIGFFVAQSSEWFLDANGNGAWDGCAIDICSSFGDTGDVPMTGRWMQNSEDRVAVFRPAQKKWYLDRNGNEVLDRCKADKCSVLKIYQAGDIPITGDWTGRGTSQLGLYRPSTGEWFLDRNGNAAWNGCKKDLCVASFGSANDMPVAGDWDGSGITKIGVFRPGTGEWFLDLNGNGIWDGSTLDGYRTGYGQAGDIPVVGKW